MSGEWRNRPLTRRELATLDLLADGLTVAEVGEKLGLAEDTIKSRIKRITVKLGTRNRAHSVAVAMRQGLIR
jgi:DNA-binding NarL/FixJ family response regulator